MFLLCMLAVVLYALYRYVMSVLERQRVDALDSRYIFITGCDTGFGHLAAKRFDALGCHVIAGCLTERGEEELRKACSSRLTTVHLNVASHDSVAKAAETVKQALPPNTGLWGVINNAGILGPMLPAELIPLQNYVDVFTVNCLGQVDVTQTFLPLLSKRGARIVNVSSMAARNAMQLIASYSISKYGVEAFSDTIRRELRPHGISVHLVEPGGHATGISAAQLDHLQRAWDAASPEAQARYGGSAYINRRLEGQRAIMAAPSPSNQGGNPENVVDAFEHALLSRYPRPRYVIGFDVKLFVIIQWLPEWLGDRLISRMFNF